MNNGSLYTHIENGIATVQFYHQASNSLPSALLQRMAKALDALEKDKNVKVIILKSEQNKTFCAGASFNELVGVSNLEEGKQFFLGFANVINAIRKCKKIVIGRIQGKAVGGGVGLIAACDYCLATEAASIKLSELTVGIGPFVIEPVVVRKIGIAAFTELTIEATQWKNAYWAKEKGLYAHVYETIEELDNEVTNLALKLTTYNPTAVKKIKETLWKNTDNWDKLLEERATISGQLVLSDFTKQALQKFKK